jgi:hypothetical protein
VEVGPKSSKEKEKSGFLYDLSLIQTIAQ